MKYSLTFTGLLVLLTASIALTQSSRNPHGKLSMECTACHTTDSWTKMRADVQFDHNKTGFRLDGAHGAAPCATCHRNLDFSRVAAACADCHSDHHEGQLGTECASCHTPRDWQPRGDVLQKHADRGFPLTGVHTVADCEACHTQTERVGFSGTPSNCEACHMNNRADATDPDHSDPIFAGDCERCHHPGLGSWQRTTYEHPGSFVLNGRHRLIRCGQCHTSTFAGTSNLCYDCHSTEYAGTTDPNHVLSALATTCQDCHSTSGWVPATFDHAATGFALTGRHVSVQCIACHPTSYAGTPLDCYSCHQPAYEATTNPNHVTSAFPTTCDDCHSTSGWVPATFDHAATGFALTGRHITVQCIACHPTSYVGTPIECYACHQPAYEATTNPDHAAALFPPNCENCHSTSGWQPSNWDHDATFFPIFSGAHNGKWGDCNVCHTDPSNFSQFDCTVCHEHRQIAMDDKHSGVRDYQFLSSACYSCHPRGRN